MQAKSVSTLLCLAAMVAALGLSACNTIAGAGKDVQATGQAVTTTAEEVKSGN